MSNNHIVSEEIKRNIDDIRYRLHIVLLLIMRSKFSFRLRNVKNVSTEYNSYWANFLKDGSLLRNDFGFRYFGKLIIPPITPLEYRQKAIIEDISEKIEKYHIKSVLEIGSGGGLNLLMLAVKFPSVKFFGLELTQKGIEGTKKLLYSPPDFFPGVYHNRHISNVTVYKGSIIEKETIRKIQKTKFDLIFTVAVLEQLYNYIDVVLKNIFSLSSNYFYFFEEWLETNSNIHDYSTLVNNDYFRLSWESINEFDDVKILDRYIPAYQPGGLKYGVVFCKKKI